MDSGGGNCVELYFHMLMKNEDVNFLLEKYQPNEQQNLELLSSRMPMSLGAFPLNLEHRW